MRGVGVFAQRQSYTKIGRRKRFYSLVWFLLDVAIHNAFILYQQKHEQSSCDEKAFRKQLMQDLVSGFSARKRKREAAARHKRPRDSLHRLARSEQPRSCHECKRPTAHGQHNVRTHWLCEDCNLHLCLPVCYYGRQK